MYESSRCIKSCLNRSEGDNQLAYDKSKRDVRKTPNLSGPLMLPNRASANSLSAPIRSSGGNRT